MTEDMRNPWTLSAHLTSKYNMQDFTNLTYTTSTQHKDLTEAGSKRDASDLEKIRTKFEACSPFTYDPTLKNIVNGIVTGPDVNVQGYPKQVPKFRSSQVPKFRELQVPNFQVPGTSSSEILK